MNRQVIMKSASTRVLGYVVAFGMLVILCQSTPITQIPQLTPTPRPNIFNPDGEISKTGFKIHIQQNNAGNSKEIPDINNDEGNPGDSFDEMDVGVDLGVTKSPDMKTEQEKEELMLLRLLQNHRKRTNRNSDYITVLADCQAHPDWCVVLQQLQQSHN